MGWIILGFLVVVIIDFVPLVMQRNTKAITAFIFLFVVTLTLAILQVLEVEIPPLLYIIETTLKSIGISYSK